jgi:hypothetical protein
MIIVTRDEVETDDAGRPTASSVCAPARSNRSAPKKGAVPVRAGEQDNVRG